MKHQTLSPVHLAFTLAIVWAIFTVLGGWFAMYGWCRGTVSVLASAYIGYAPTFVGALIGGIWGFAHGFIAGGLVGYFYNSLIGE